MERGSSAGTGYLPGLDGLRALAVLAVIVYHSGLGWLPGGFLGVEVFFVISGFIITAGLRRERHNGRISFRHFWKRRALRLLPALFLVLVAVLVYAELFAGELVPGLARDTGAALAYVTNWYLIADGQSYFGGFEEPSMLRHLWSLAIEEQFYVVWPVVIAAGLALLRPKTLAAFLALLAVASAVLMLVLFERGADISRLYYGTDTRASGLLLGAALALAWLPPVGGRTSPGTWRLDMAGGAALVGLAACCLLLTDAGAALYRGGFLLVDALTALAIIVAVQRSRVSGALGARPMQWIGVRSYGLYLWHWPVIVAWGPGFDWPGGSLATFVMQMAVTFLLAAASYRRLEAPVRGGALGRAWERMRAPRRRAVRARMAGAMGSAAVVAGLMVISTVALTADERERPDYFELEQVRAGVIANEETSSVSGVSYFGIRAGGAMAWGRTGMEQLGLPLPSTPEAGPPDEAIEPTPTTATPAAAEPEPEPSPEPTPEPSSATLAGVYVTAVGDSVMLGAAHQMGAVIAGIDVDAMVNRYMDAAITILEQRQAQRILADTVVLHIGNNGPIRDGQLDRVAEIVGDRRTILVTLRVPRSWEGANNAAIEAAVGRYPNFELLDWREASGERPDALWTDGIHLRPAGAAFYTELVADLVANPPVPPDPVLSEIELPPEFVRP